MKKLMFSISLLLLVAFAITACSAATPAVPTATVGSVPTTAATGAATSAATTAPTTAATSAPTTAVTTAATAAATVTATAAAALTTPQATQTGSAVVVTTGTPSASVQGQFVRLSILLQSSLVTNAETGKITGVVLGQPGISASGAAPAAGQVSVPYVRYILVNMNGGSSAAAKEILLPWQMFQFNTTTASNGTFSQTFSLKGPAASRANVPQVSLPNETGILQSGWDSQLSSYWASQGFAIPVTGASPPPETDVLLRADSSKPGTLAGTNIADNNSKVLGQVADFLIDPANGQFVYAVFNGGSLFGNKSFIVPVKNLIIQLNNASASGLGNIQLNFNSNILNTAPSIDLNQLMQNPALLQQIINFWQSIQVTK